MRLPLFTVLPYIQPGANSLLQDGKESMIVAWQTFAGAAEFSVEFGATPQYGAAAVVTHVARTAGKGGDAEQRFNWTAEAAGLTLGRKYYYRVRGNGPDAGGGLLHDATAAGAPDPLRRLRRQLLRRHQRSRDRVSHLQAEPRFRDELRRQRLRERYRRRVSAYFFPVYNADRRRAARRRAAASFGAVLHGDRQSRRAGQGREQPRDRRLHTESRRAGVLHRDAPAAERSGGAFAPDADDGTGGERSRSFAPAPAPASRGWRTTRSTTATRISSASTRTATSIRTTGAADLDCRGSRRRRRDLEVRRLPSSAVQRRRRTLRGAAHAGAGTAVRSARRRRRDERTRAQLPAGASVEVRSVGTGNVRRPRREGSPRARLSPSTPVRRIPQHAPERRPLHRDRRGREASLRSPASPTTRRGGRTPTTAMPTTSRRW